MGKSVIFRHQNLNDHLMEVRVNGERVLNKRSCIPRKKVVSRSRLISQDGGEQGYFCINGIIFMLDQVTLFFIFYTTFEVAVK
jgi:hypothetical protein